MSKAELLSQTTEDLVERICRGFRLVAPCLKKEDIHTLGTEETEIDVSDNILYGGGQGYTVTADGTQLTIVVPYTGTGHLFRLRPSAFTSNPPRGDVRESELHLHYEVLPTEHSDVEDRYRRDVDGVEKHLQWVRNDIAGSEPELRNRLVQTIEERRKRLLRDAELLNQLGIPVKRDSEAVRTFAVPDVRRRPLPQPRQTGTRKPEAPEPTIPMEVYEHILEVMGNLSVLIERSPHAFSRMGEEQLRDHMLVQLNGHYEGRATGETFSCAGKTDILVSVERRSVFVAECKFWKGKKNYLEAIDQLLSYTTWRDSKTALVIFNRNRDHSRVLRQIESATKEHGRYKRCLGRPSETEFRFLLEHPEDPERDLFMAVLAINLPAAT